MGAFASAFYSKIAGGFAEASDEAKQKRQASEREQRMGMSKVLQNMLGDEDLKPEVAARIIPKLFELWTAKPGKSVKVDINEIYSPKRAPEQQILGATPQRRQFEQRRTAGEPQLGPPPPPVPSMGVPPPPPGYQVGPQDIAGAYISPEEQQRRATQAQFETSRAQAMGRAAGTPAPLPKPPVPTPKQKDFEYLTTVRGMEPVKARKLMFGLLPDEKASKEDNTVFIDPEGNKIAVFFTREGVQKRVNLGKARITGDDFTAAERNFQRLLKEGPPTEEWRIEARRLAFGLTSTEKETISDFDFAVRIMNTARQAYGDTSQRSIKRALDQIFNVGFPSKERITLEQVAKWFRSGRGVPTPPGGRPMETRTYGGRTYQRPTGSNEEWRLIEQQ